jgi:hypothetical protein
MFLCRQWNGSVGPTDVGRKKSLSANLGRYAHPRYIHVRKHFKVYLRSLDMQTLGTYVHVRKHFKVYLRNLDMHTLGTCP